jgi:hypothetical protein
VLLVYAFALSNLINKKWRALELAAPRNQHFFARQVALDNAAVDVSLERLSGGWEQEDEMGFKGVKSERLCRLSGKLCMTNKTAVSHLMLLRCSLACANILVLSRRSRATRWDLRSSSSSFEISFGGTIFNNSCLREGEELFSPRKRGCDLLRPWLGDASEL